MPLYEYKCNSCGDVFEVLQSFSDKPLTVHTKCGGKVERLISPPALQFKGTGWYVTDYGRASNGRNGKSSSGDKDKKPEAAPTTDTSKSEKPAAK